MLRLNMKHRRIEIHCPLCSWKPTPASRWQCRPGCGHVWNTFDTGGICPACGHAWKTTACLSCPGVPPHPDWYHETGGATAKRTEQKSEPAHA